MEFEGTHNVVGLRGIERNAADLVMKDGAMEEAIGLIPRDGSLVPYAPKPTQRSTGLPLFVRVHHTQNEDHTIEVYADHYVVYGPKGIVKPVDEHDTSTNVAVKEIVFVGNRMDIQTEDGIEHWLWKNEAYRNVGDLDDGASLPYVEFKVERGIYDGSKTYKSARFVRVNDHYTDAATDRVKEDEVVKEAYGKKYLIGDALAITDSVRAAGGITGYILVAAAWRRKGSTPSNPQYIMASPIMLMGAPEIYMKDGDFESANFTYVDRSIFEQDGKRKTFVLDTTDLHGEESSKEIFDALWNITPTDDRDAEELTDGENFDIEKEEENHCVMRMAHLYVDHYIWPSVSNVNMPALYQERFAMYNHGDRIPIDDADAMYRSVTISHATANVLNIRLKGTLQDNYKDEIDRLCVFISPIINPYKGVGDASISMESNYAEVPVPVPDEGEPLASNVAFQIHRGTHAGAVFKWTELLYAGSFTPEMKAESEIIDNIKNIAGLYKIREYGLTEISENDGWVKVDLHGKLDTEKLVQHTDTMLKISDMQPVGFVSGNIFGYNERLHVYNFQKNQVFRLPYEAMGYYGGAGQYEGNHIDPQDPTPFVTYKYQVQATDSNGSLITRMFESINEKLNPMVSLSDAESTKVKIVKKALTKYGQETHTPVPMAGILSAYVTPDLKPLNITCNAILPTDPDSIFAEDDIKPDSLAYGKNEIRVSNTATTLFEAESSYKVGHGEIIGMARLTMGLSQDNYGKYPLVIFCTDGIYTMDVDATGQTAYRVQSALGRQICSNRNGICEIDGAVLFPTEQGLFVVTENGVQAVALHVRGAADGYPAEHKGLDILRNAANHQKLVTLSDAFSKEDFLNYVNGEKCHIRYIAQLSMVVCYRSDKVYSYVLSVGDWSAWKLRAPIVADDMDYPKALFYMKDGAGSTGFTFDWEQYDTNTQCLLETQPIKLETTHQKAAYRVVLRGEFVNSVTDSAEEDEDNKKFYAGLYVFGSYDGRIWYPMGGKEKLLKRFTDFGVETHRSSFRLMKIVFVGKLSKDSHIDGLEITNEVRYNDKLK